MCASFIFVSVVCVCFRVCVICVRCCGLLCCVVCVGWVCWFYVRDVCGCALVCLFVVRLFVVCGLNCVRVPFVVCLGVCCV